MSACTPEKPNQNQEQGTQADNFEFLEWTVDQFIAAQKNGSYSAKQIVEKYLDRIKKIDSKDGLGLNSILEVNPDALSIADQLDQDRKAGKAMGPLHGIPVILKDNIDTGDKMMTTAGALALVGNIAQQDAWVAKQLRKAGAIILAKANLSEWANFRSTRSSSGWSGRGKQTRNPFILDRSPCGSSAGSGASVSANLCAIAVGTETNGSIVCPSSSNGVVGIKPTVGLWGRSGIIPISSTQDTAGPMARTLKDAAIMLGTVCGMDPRDEQTSESKGKFHQDYTQFLDLNGLQGSRIGLGKNFMGFHSEVDQIMEEALALMKEKGATIIELESITPNGLGRAGFDLMLYEFKDGVDKYLQSVTSSLPVKNLKEVVEWNNQNAEASMPFFGQEILEMAIEKGDLSETVYQEALAKSLKFNREDGIDKVMDEHQLDAIIGPTGGPAWPIDLVNGDHFGGGSSSPAARAGYPNITIPAGFVHGLPVGISFFGRAWSEPQLLKISYAYEQASNHRKAPTFSNTLSI